MSMTVDPTDEALALCNRLERLGVPGDLVQPIRDFIASDEDGHLQVENDPVDPDG